MTVAGTEYPEWQKEYGGEARGPRESSVVTVPVRWHAGLEEELAVCPVCNRAVMLDHAETRCEHYVGTEPRGEYTVALRFRK